jgi:signal transduction histidine kinase
VNDSLNFIVTAIAAMLLLAFGIVFFVVLFQRRIIRHQQQLKKINEEKQQELLIASIESEEKERMRIASELHDDIGTTLTSIKLLLYNTTLSSPSDNILLSNKLLEESIKKIRTLSHNLQPSTLLHLGLNASLTSLADTINKSGVVKITCQLTTNNLLNENDSLAAFRIVQELTNNILKYAAATYIHLESHSDNSHFHLTLSHDGQGLSQKQYDILLQKKDGIGLKNIKNRIQSVSGIIEFSTSQPNKNEISITIPIVK